MSYDIRNQDNVFTPFTKARGVKKLANWVEKLLLTSYGSDSKYPNTGCYLKALIGQHFGSLEEVANEISREVKRVEEQIKSIQRDEARRGRRIAPAERLSSLNLIDVSEDGGEDDLWGISATYELVNGEGEALQAEVPFEP